MKQLTRDQMKHIKGGDTLLNCCGCETAYCNWGTCGVLIDNFLGFACDSGPVLRCIDACAHQDG